MTLNRLIAIAVFAVSTGIATFQADAQIREQQPAEFPPASYKGKQYVDSQGCVFIRAGIDGDVSWVPRVTRSRKTVCGFKPSLSSRVTSAVPAARPVEAPVKITINDAPAGVPAPKPGRVAAPARKPAPVVVRQTASKPKPRVVQQPAVVAAAPAALAPAPVKARRGTQVASGCRGASALSQQYMRSTSGAPVRCGPQAAQIVGTGHARSATPQTIRPTAPAQPRRQAAYATATDGVTAHTRIIPRHVAGKRVNTHSNVSVPPGYKQVWQDGRLNPRRAEQSLAGRSDMLLIWTQTVPRRLINQQTGRDVTASVPLVYPYVSIATQRRELGEVVIVQRDGQLVKRIVRNNRAVPRKVVKRQPVYSSRSTAKPRQPKAAVATPSRTLAGKTFVQVGTYGNPANAQAAAQKIARLGMPARIGEHRESGKTYMTVQAGPFTDSRSMQNAMRRIKDAGYRDAFARN